MSFLNLTTSAIQKGQTWRSRPCHVLSGPASLGHGYRRGQLLLA